MKQPCVYLVGAGPGDPTLISVRGQRYLEAADVVIYDHRVHSRLLPARDLTPSESMSGRRLPNRSSRKPSVFFLPKKRAMERRSFA